MKMPSKTLIIKSLIFFIMYEDDKWQRYNVRIVFPVFPIQNDVKTFLLILINLI